MTVHAAIVGQGGRVQRTVKTERRDLRGYATSRQDYDRRRRRTPLDHAGRAYRGIVQHDVCSTPGCGHRALPGRELNAADHIVPLQNGGRNVWENLTSLCRPCNASKKNRDLLTFLLDRKEARRGDHP